jgi:hypothetical protein
MMVFAIGIEHAHVVSVQRLQRGDPGEKHPCGRLFGSAGQHLRCCRDRGQAVLGFRNCRGEMLDGIAQGAERRAVRCLEFAPPTVSSHQAKTLAISRGTRGLGGQAGGSAAIKQRRSMGSPIFRHLLER